MNPIALAGAWGFLKGLAQGQTGARRDNHFGAWVAGPLLEEATFRSLGSTLPAPVSSALFAASHLTSGMVAQSPGFSAYRFAEVFAGGMMYEKAFRRWGFKGAVGAHMLHNIACTLGAICSPRLPPKRLRGRR